MSGSTQATAMATEPADIRGDGRDGGRPVLGLKVEEGSDVNMVPAPELKELREPPTPTRVSAGRCEDRPKCDEPWVMCDPEDVGMDREPLEKCRRYLRYRIGRKHFAGIVSGVVKNGKLVYFDESGYADIEKKVPVKQDTLMRLFSMTKCIVVVAFLAYAEDPAYGVDLDDPVWKYIPSFKDVKLAPRRGSSKPTELETCTITEKTADGKTRKVQGPFGPTLRHLLTHTAGLGYGPTFGDSFPPKSTDHYKIYYELLDKTQKGEIKSLEEWIDELAKVPLKVRPGSYWEYSFASDVLGRVLEVISGLPLDTAVQEKVCGPLGMVDTSFSVPLEKAHRVGAWYEKKNPVDEHGKVLEKVPPGATYNLNVIDKAGAESGWVGDNVSTILSGGGTVEVPLAIKGGMVSTFRDYLRFLMMIRNFGELDGARVLRRETVQLMICNQIPASTGRRSAWVFDKKGQGFSFIGQIQVQHFEKDTFLEKGLLQRGTTTLAALAPGTVSAEYGWGGLAGPAWTIDPRSDLIILSMTQTALELDHEENLRFSARRAIHAGIFGPTAGPMKVTDFPPEGHEGLRRSKLHGGLDRSTDAELSAFMEAEEQALARGKTLKELAVSTGNAGHEVFDDDEEAGSSKGDGPHADRDDDSRSRKRPLDRNSSGSSDCSQKRQAGTKHESEAGAPFVDEEGDPKELLFSRVRVAEDGAFRKARVTAVDGNTVEVVTEGSWHTVNLSVGDVVVIDETRQGKSKKVETGPKDFAFLLSAKGS